MLPVVATSPCNFFRSKLWSKFLFWSIGDSIDAQGYTDQQYQHQEYNQGQYYDPYHQQQQQHYQQEGHNELQYHQEDASQQQQPPEGIYNDVEHREIQARC